MAKPVATSPAPETPTDTGTPPPQATEPKKVPNRGIKKRVLGEGEGDYCIGELVGQDQNMPKGSIVPIPAIPRFIDTAAAMKWIRNESGDLLAGKQVMIFKACEILNLVIQTKPTVVIQTKPKITVTKPETSNG